MQNFRVINCILFLVVCFMGTACHALGQIPAFNGLYKFPQNRRHRNEDKGDKVLDTQSFPFRPFKHIIGLISLPDSLGGKK